MCFIQNKIYRHILIRYSVDFNKNAGGNAGFPGGDLSIFTYDGCPRSALTAGEFGLTLQDGNIQTPHQYCCIVVSQGIKLKAGRVARAMATVDPVALLAKEGMVIHSMGVVEAEDITAEVAGHVSYTYIVYILID